MITFEVCYDAPQDGLYWCRPAPVLRRRSQDGAPDSRYASFMQRDGARTVTRAVVPGGGCPADEIRLEAAY
jgi:hypothetical protein